MATRFLLNPTFDIATGELLSHEGETFTEAVMLFDRGATSAAKDLRKTSEAQAGQSGAEATSEKAAVLPGIIQSAQNPQGYSPTDLNNMQTALQQGAGGANAAVTGEGRLAAMRTRGAGGYAPALAEAARSKGRTLAAGGLDIQNMNAQLKQQQQQEARNQLLGISERDRQNQLQAMGLSNQDLETQLAAGRQGWVQNVNQSIEAGSGLVRALKGK